MILAALNQISEAGSVLHRNLPWMSWNLFLAFVPLVLSLWLFYPRQARSPLWWVVLLVFIAFLPNAPYVLTDIIHLVRQIRYEPSIWMISLVIIPQYCLFMLLGFGAYALSLVRLGKYLLQQGRRRWVLPAELGLHGLSAIGVYLGRFDRFNSWDFVTQPGAVIASAIDNLLSRRALLIMAIAFVIIAGLYWIMKQVILGLMQRRHTLRTTKFRATEQSN